MEWHKVVLMFDMSQYRLVLKVRPILPIHPKIEVLCILAQEPTHNGGLWLRKVPLSQKISVPSLLQKPNSTSHEFVEYE